MHEKSYAKSNHPAKQKTKGGLSGSVKKSGSHATLVGKENPTDRTKASSKASKSMASLNPLYHPGNKMEKS